MTTKNSLGRKPTKFDPFIAARGLATERLVINAARTLDASKYRNITEYCKPLAQIISQLRESEAQNKLSPFYSGKCKNFSHVTLLRNEIYREIVERVFNASRSNPIDERSIEGDLDVLKAQNAGLVAQITLLKSKIISMDASQEDVGSIGLIGEYEESGAIIDELNHKIFLCLKLFRLLRFNTLKAVHLVEESTVEKEAGLYGIWGLIASSGELDQLSFAEESLPTELRKQLKAAIEAATAQSG